MCRLSTDSAPVKRDSSACPFTIRELNITTHLIRENDRFGEYPHIYVKLISQTDQNGHITKVLVITDTGVGTASAHTPEHPVWTIKSFIDHNLNPNGEIPYLVILSHCHFDHILGLPSILNSKQEDCADKKQVTILSSSYQPSFTTPYANLEKHSLCKTEQLPTPVYETSIWAADNAPVIFKHPSGIKMELPIITFHTPGHTPDSLSWYDTEERTLYVGDSFYERESAETRDAPWGPERPAPIIFPLEGNLYDWWQSVKKLIHFVGEKNSEMEKRVTLGAGHVTSSADAHTCLANAKEFVARILRDEAVFVEWPERRGERLGYWGEEKGRDGLGRFSVAAPIRIVEEGRREIPRAEWEEEGLLI